MTQIHLSNNIIISTKCCKPIIEKARDYLQPDKRSKIDLLSKDIFYDFRSYKAGCIHNGEITVINKMSYIKIDSILWVNFLDNILKNYKDENFYINQYSLQNSLDSYFYNYHKKEIFYIIPKLSAILADYQYRSNIINTNFSPDELILTKNIFKYLSSPLAYFTHKKFLNESFLELITCLNQIIVNDQNHYLWYYHLEKQAVNSTRLKLVKICIIIVKYFLLI